MTKRFSKKAFTMIELLVCLVCLGFLTVGIAAFAKKLTGAGASKNDVSPETVDALEALKKTAKEMLEQPQYNFFRIGYYVYKHPETDLSQMPADEANEMAGKFLDEDFMNAFISLGKIAVQYSFDKNIENKKTLTSLFMNLD